MLPLSPITMEQITKGELKDLLTESDYDLTTMVRPYSNYLLNSIKISFKSIDTDSNNSLQQFF